MGFSSDLNTFPSVCRPMSRLRNGCQRFNEWLNKWMRSNPFLTRITRRESINSHTWIVKGRPRMKKLGLSIMLLCILAGLTASHPHIQKTVAASAQGLQLKLTYFTLPYNSEHLTDIKEGFVFHCGRATLEISGEIESEGVKLLAGQYLVRAKASSADEWTLLLIPETPAGSRIPHDFSQAISLKSRSLTGQSEAHHLNLDLTSGHGSTDGNLILSVAFGSRTVEGVLSPHPGSLGSPSGSTDSKAAS